MICRTVTIECNLCREAELFDEHKGNMLNQIRNSKVFADVPVPEGFDHDGFHICKKCKPEYIKSCRAVKRIWNRYRQYEETI